MITAIILAAGESKRFGSPKQLAKINNQDTLIEHLIKTLDDTCVDETIVVLGAHREEIQQILPKNIKISINEQFQKGQTSSLKCGLKKVSNDCKRFLVFPVDTPLIKSETINEIINKFILSKANIGIPTYADQKGHPPIYDIKLKTEILELKNEQPLYLINQKFAANTLLIEVFDPGVLININTPQDLEKLKK